MPTKQRQKQVFFFTQTLLTLFNSCTVYALNRCIFLSLPPFSFFQSQETPVNEDRFKPQSTYCYSSWCVQMDDTADVRAGLVDGRVQSEASLADAQPRRPGVHNLSTNIYLDQRAGSDF